ncbi:MAG: trypsin-like peptidase domain-containing protein [Ignavibacteriae bacterium]|nr:trypsin-like peptidase domain-containing protein [Ignavibacteriota bacterium]
MFFIFLFLTLHFSSSTQTVKTITKLESLQSLYIEVYRDSSKLGNATGFVIKSKTQYYLVTNYHVVTKKNPINNQWLDSTRPIAPNRIVIAHHANKLGNYVIKTEPLLDKSGNSLWYQNNINKEMVDVIELPLKDTLGVSFYPVNYHSSAYDSVLITPTDRVFILGFPLGLKSNSEFPIWKSGLLASEPDFDQDGKPIIWVDAITFPGMSGSPVYFMSNEVVTLKDGRSAFVRGNSAFIGVFAYSHAFNVYGALWKASYLRPIFDKLP